MGQLPNAGNAAIDGTKVRDYLLSDTHVYGKSKAAFFRRFGFERERWEDLRGAIRQHAVKNAVTTTEETTFGTKYVVEGPFETPDGRRPWVRSVWFVSAGHQTPRLVTVYPLEERRDDQ